MNTLGWIVAGVAGYALVVVFTLALCKAAARGDEINARSHHRETRGR